MVGYRAGLFGFGADCSCGIPLVCETLAGSLPKIRRIRRILSQDPPALIGLLLGGVTLRWLVFLAPLLIGRSASGQELVHLEWNPDQLELALQPGTVVSTPVELVCPVHLDGLRLSADSQLAKFFVPSEVVAVEAGVSATVYLTFYARTSQPGGRYEGVVEAVPGFIRGDSNADGVLDISDAVFTLLYLFTDRVQMACEDAADANDDGRLNVADPLYLLPHLFRGGPAPADPLAAPGFDPTPDDLHCVLGLPLPVTINVAFPVTPPEAFTDPSGDRIVVDPDTGQPIIGEELFAVMPEGSSRAEAEALAVALGGFLTGGRGDLGFYEIRVPGTSPRELKSLAEEAMRRSPDLVVGPTRLTLTTALDPPNDEQYWLHPDTPDRWDEHSPSGINHGLELIQALSAWRSLAQAGRPIGSRTTHIAVIDHIGFRHRDLLRDGVVFRRINGDHEWHGLHVAGIAAATANNNEGIAGVCWGCSLDLYAASSFDTECSAYYLSPKLIFDGIREAINGTARAGSDRLVINLSLGAEFCHKVRLE